METLGFIGMLTTLAIVAYVAYTMSKPHSLRTHTK